MTDLEVLKERKICAVCVDCTDQDCLTCNKVNGSTLAEINLAFDNAIQALQEKAEREKMRCENCINYSPRASVIFCGRCGAVINHCDFCSYFEPKESEGKNHLQKGAYKMARNRYAGYCYCCGNYVNVGFGHFERNNGGWRIKCVKCARGRTVKATDREVTKALAERNEQNE